MNKEKIIVEDNKIPHFSGTNIYSVLRNSDSVEIMTQVFYLSEYKKMYDKYEGNIGEDELIDLGQRTIHYKTEVALIKEFLMKFYEIKNGIMRDINDITSDQMDSIFKTINEVNLSKIIEGKENPVESFLSKYIDENKGKKDKKDNLIDVTKDNCISIMDIASMVKKIWIISDIDGVEIGDCNSEYRAIKGYDDFCKWIDRERELICKRLYARICYLNEGE